MFGWYYDKKIFDKYNNDISIYLQKISLESNGKTFDDNLDNDFNNRNEGSSIDYVNKIIKDSVIDITPEMIIKWGKNFDIYEYLKLENLYNDMITINPRLEETPQDKDYLRKMCLNSVLLDRALMDGDEKRVKPLSDSYSKTMMDMKLRAMDKTDADKTGGIRTFSQIYGEVEKDDFIWPWEKYRKMKGVKPDIVDRTIFHILNHMRSFAKMPKLTSVITNEMELNQDEVDDAEVEIYNDTIQENDGE
jgi:hypothetical protein